MELYLAGILLGAGYMMNQLKPSTQNAATNNEETKKYLNSMKQAAMATNKPSQQNVYQSRRSKDVFEEEQRLAYEAAVASMNPEKTGVVDRNARWLTDRQFHGEDPYVGEKPPQTQYSSLLGKEMPIEHFKHNNMMPYYKGSSDAKQPSNFSDFKLETYTGTNVGLKKWGQKKAIEMYKPEPQGRVSSSGRVMTEYDRDAALASIQAPRSRANETPAGLAPMTVGRPGVVGAGWADTRDKVHYETVDDLRPLSNPKVTYAGRTQGPPSTIVKTNIDAMDAPKQLPPKRAPILTPSVIGASATQRFTQKLREGDYRDIRGTERQNTDRRSAYTGAAGKGVVEGMTMGYGSQKTRVMDPFKSSLAAPNMGPAMEPSAATIPNNCGQANWGLYGNNRDVTGTRTYTGNITSPAKKNVNPFADVAKTTIKESTEQTPRPYGIATGPDKNIVYDTNDVARTTIKEQTIDNSDNAVRNRGLTTAESGVVYDPAEWRARTTNKQITSEKDRMEGRVGGQTTSYGTYNANYDAKTTMRQTIDETGGTTYGPVGGTSEEIGGYSLWPDYAKATQKQDTSQRDHYGPMGHAQQYSYENRTSADNMTIRPEKEDVIFGREPTQVSTKLAAGKDQQGDMWFRGNADLQAFNRLRAPDGSYAQRLPANGAFLDAEGVLSGRKIAIHKDLGEKGGIRPSAPDGTPRINDEMCGHHSQQQSNPYAVPSFDGK